MTGLGSCVDLRRGLGFALVCQDLLAQKVPWAGISFRMPSEIFRRL
jgi:hypothetical protein